MIKLKTRTLLNNGISILTDDEMFERILRGMTEEEFEYLKVKRSEDAELFELLYRVKMIYDKSETDIEAQILSDGDEDELINYLFENKRDDDISDNDHQQRVERELEFFTSKEIYFKFLFTLKNLISKFKKEDVVWGVGRGSSCASYVLYLLEVHDINPIRYDIDFREFSKEE